MIKQRQLQGDTRNILVVGFVASCYKIFNGIFRGCANLTAHVMFFHFKVRTAQSRGLVVNPYLFHDINMYHFHSLPTPHLHHTLTLIPEILFSFNHSKWRHNLWSRLKCHTKAVTWFPCGFDLFVLADKHPYGMFSGKIYTKNHKLSRCQLCCHCSHRKFSSWKIYVPQVSIKSTSWRLSVFSVRHIV